MEAAGLSNTSAHSLTIMSTSILDDAHSVALIASECAAESESGRRLASPVVEALRDTQAFRMFVPKQYNGPEVDPVTALDVVMTLAAGDGAAGWCATIASLTSHGAGTVDPHWASVIFGDRRAITGGAFAPTGTATKVGAETGSGYTVDGRWAWGSGSQNCNWLCGGAIDDEGVFRLMFFPADEVTIHDTWDSSGLRGTGSHDLEVRHAVVPDGRWLLPFGAKLQVDSDVSRMPMYTLFAGGVAAVMLGIARHAIDELLLVAPGKRPMGSMKSLAQSPLSHHDIGRAEAILSSARAWLRDETAAAWELVQAGSRVPTDLRVRIRAAATHASVSARQATDIAYDLAGGTAVYSKSPLQRCFRDVHTASAHIMVTSRNFETYGRHRLGLPIDTSML